MDGGVIRHLIDNYIGAKYLSEARSSKRVTVSKPAPLRIEPVLGGLIALAAGLAISAAVFLLTEYDRGGRRPEAEAAQERAMWSRKVGVE